MRWQNSVENIVWQNDDRRKNKKDRPIVTDVTKFGC